MKPPPLGVNPRYLHDEQRYGALAGAIRRYLSGGYPLPLEWVVEYNELVERLAKVPDAAGPTVKWDEPDTDPVTKAYVEEQIR